MLARTLLLGILAASIVARGIECASVEVNLCQLAADLRAEMPPITNPHDADPNESGCLCKGALGGPCLIAAMEFPCRLVAVAAIDDSPPLYMRPADASWVCEAVEAPWPLAEGTLRAHCRLWQI